ncbi:MAG: translation initiation factor IF-2, partial [Phycisphaerae bacterium]
GPKTEAKIYEPVHMKEFCAATGLNFMQCFKVLKDEHNLMANVNMTLPTETAQLLALHFGIELTVVPAKTGLDSLQEEFAERKREQLEPRPPVVTMLGHVDHGKTSLLDAIRKTRVVAGEDGGITQHIGAYHIETARHAVTFLDTPGHAAFTAMRARGARLTDVVVLVVAADDGLMPQTLEAINHAKAAEVPIVVALNKIDLGDQNQLKIFGQLAENGLTPSGEWGGDVDVIKTSATTGEGIDTLVEHLADLSSLLELQADPTMAATGAAIEAETKAGVGSVVRVLVQEGTLHVGDFVVCGPAFGKVRALLNDRGQRVQEVGPAQPAEIWGLDDVPTAGDKFFCVENLQRAKEIATEIKQSRVEKARVQSQKVNTLEEMMLRRDAEEVPELNLIIKADVDGSAAALRQALGDLPSDEVKLTIRHSGVGAITDSDVHLAGACEGIVVAFRVEASVNVRRLAEQHGVDIRTYRVIYDVVDDIKAALEGLLAPEEKIESRATAEVRQVFRVSKTGMIAGSYVTEGTLDRNHLAKVVRDGVLVRDRCKIASLRRFKDDVKEVRAGLECGIRLEGFDDLHVGDVVESFEIVQIARTL